MRRRGAPLAVLAASTALTCELLAGCTRAGSGSGPSTATAHKLWRIAQDAAQTDNGKIMWAHAIRTTRAQASQATHGQAARGLSDPVWLLVIRARDSFTCTTCPRPPGAESPGGRYMTLVLDGRTLNVSESEGSDYAPNVAGLGPVIQLHG